MNQNQRLRNSQRRFPWGLLIALIIILSIGFSLYQYFTPPNLFDKNDPICELVREKYSGMKCVPLASPQVYERGAFVSLMNTEKSLDSLGLPDGYILSKECLLPSANVSSAIYKEDENKYIQFGKYTFNINKNLTTGADINIPKAGGFSLKAGPQLSKAKAIILTADEGRFFNIEDGSLKTILSGCQLKESCILNAKNSNHQIIKQLLVAKNLKYTVETDQGVIIPLSVALENKILNIGFNSTRDIVSTTDLSSGKDMVFAVKLFDSNHFAQIMSCEQGIVIEAVNGRTTANSKIILRKKSEPENIIEREEENISIRDEEVKSAIVQKMEKGDISRTGAEAWGKWIFDQQFNTVELLSRNSIYFLKYLTPQLTNDYFIESQASIKHNIEISITNRLDQAKILSMELTNNLNTSINSPNIPADQFFKVFTVEKAQKIKNIPILWTTTDKSKIYNLGQIEPLKPIKINLERLLNSNANNPENAGSISEDLKIKFFIK